MQSFDRASSFTPSFKGLEEFSSTLRDDDVTYAVVEVVVRGTTRRLRMCAFLHLAHLNTNFTQATNTILLSSCLLLGLVLRSHQVRAHVDVYLPSSVYFF